MLILVFCKIKVYKSMYEHSELWKSDPRVRVYFNLCLALYTIKIVNSVYHIKYRIFSSLQIEIKYSEIKEFL